VEGGHGGRQTQRSLLTGTVMILEQLSGYAPAAVLLVTDLNVLKWHKGTASIIAFLDILCRPVFLFKTQHFYDSNLSSSSNKSFLSWAQSVELISRLFH
jgi:hypothetical protein